MKKKHKKWTSRCGRATLYQGDCREVLTTLRKSSISAIITDPPYAEVNRKYGRLTEAEWHALINPVMEESRRVLAKRGSGVYILQPNSEKVGRLRLWMFEFLVKWGREWNMIQDVWWWNHATVPSTMATQKKLCRASLKICAWFGAPDCYRNQKAVLLHISEQETIRRLSDRQRKRAHPSGHSTHAQSMAKASYERGGATPFNVIPLPNTSSRGNNCREFGHGASTPHKLLDWWIRYISKPNQMILDPFLGTGSTGIAAIGRGRRFVGIEQDEKYFELAKSRIKGALAKPRLLNE